MIHVHGEGRDGATATRPPAHLRAGMCLEHEIAASASLDSPKHPKSPPKHLKDILHLRWLLNHAWEMFGRVEGPVQNCANDFSSHRREWTTESLQPGLPWDSGEEAANTSRVLQSSDPHRDPTRAARVWGRRARGDHQEITSPPIRRHGAHPGQQPMCSTTPRRVRLQNTRISVINQWLPLFLSTCYPPASLLW